MQSDDLRSLVQMLVKSRALSKGGETLLSCLVRHHPGGADDSAIAKELGRTSEWNKLHSDVRTAIHRLRRELREFFKYDPEGKTSRQCLNIPLGTPYRIQVVGNQRNLDPIEQFWDAHFNNDAGNLIVYTEPLFFWDAKERCYIRYLDLNDESPSLDSHRIRSSIPLTHRVKDLTPCYHYQASGETQAQRILRKWFEHQKESDISVKISRECVDREVWEHNLVVLGNNRTNKFLRALQDKQKFRLEVDRIVIEPHDHKRAQEFIDLQPSSREPTGRYVYAIVTRGPSRVAQRTATTIAANHGRAIEKVSEYLTSENTLGQLYKRLSLSGTLPSRFQLLFRVQTVDFELAAGDAELVDFSFEHDRAKAKVIE